MYKIKSGRLLITVEQEEWVYSALLRQNLDLKVACKNGVCGICEAQVLEGLFWDGMSNKQVAPGKKVRLCRAKVLADSEIETNTIKKLGEIPLKEFSCQVAQVETLSDDVFRVVLRMPAGSLAEFKPGQYMSINMPDSDPAFFSIASLPGSREIELHVQASPERESAMAVLNHIRDSVTVKITLPYGEACLSDMPSGPVVLLAAGTGYAQIRSILDALRAKSFSESISIFWGGRNKEELYLLDEITAVTSNEKNLSITTVYSDVEDNEWPGHHDQLVDAVLEKHPNLSAHTIFASGSPGMVYTALDAFLENGLVQANFYSDVFEYAPRD